MVTEKAVVKNLLFDLGGVIMDIERDRCVASLTALGMDNASELLGLYVQSGAFLELEEGKITASEFRNAMRERISTNVSDAQLDAAFNDFLIGIPTHRLKSLRKLKQQYKVFMLSNTNSIMFDSKIDKCFRAEGYTVDDYFDGIALSYKAKCAKPSPEIFNYTIAHLAINPAETVFFDDSQKNLDAAVPFGFQTHLVVPGTEFMDYFKK
ncbi:MAG: HAD family phosphatase [Muribaculaceae bacterium]